VPQCRGKRSPAISKPTGGNYDRTHIFKPHVSLHHHPNERDWCTLDYIEIADELGISVEEARLKLRGSSIW